MENKPEEINMEETRRPKHGKDYMMRSEKRPEPEHLAEPDAPRKRRRRKRRRRAGFFYIFFMILFLLTLWPVGAIMLTRRKVRWRWTTKLLTAIVTLVLIVVAVGFGLTVQTGDPQITAMQDKVNDYIAHFGEYTLDGATVAAQKLEVAWDTAADIGDSLWRISTREAADSIDAAVNLAGSLRGKMTDRTATPDITPETMPNVTPSDTVGVDTALPTEGVEETSPEVTGSSTPGSTAETQAAETSETAGTSAVPEETAAAKEISVAVKPAGEAVVYYSDDSELYHLNDTCGDATGLTAHTLAEANEAGKQPCEDCIANRLADLNADTLLWMDEDQVIHTTDECEKFVGSWSLLEPIDAVNDDLTFCDACGADRWLTEAAVTPEPENAEETTETAEQASETAETTEEPSETADDAAGTMSFAETEAPEPTESVETAEAGTVKPFGEAKVYYNDSGSYYHLHSSCVNMESAAEHTLADAIAAGKQPCSRCMADHIADLDADTLLWMDANGKVHTTDECEAFEGDWTLIRPIDAVDADRTFCHACGAAGWLVESGITPTPTETPEPTPTPEPTEEPTPTPEPTEEPTPEPTEEPTPEPTPEPIVVTPSKALKDSGEAIVYHSTSGSFYHTSPVCGKMQHGKEYTLASSIAAGFRQCQDCGAPAADLKMGLWLDENNVCHTTDECTAFAGSYRLIERDDALEQGLTGCPDCGCDEYLQPGTVIGE